MNLRVLAITLPLWALLGPAVCSVGCGLGHGEHVPIPADEHAGAVDDHQSPENTAVHAAGPSGEAVPACADPSSDRAIDCCDETIAVVAEQAEAPGSNLALTLTAFPTRLASNRLPSHSDPKRFTAPQPPYSCANPPLLI